MKKHFDMSCVRRMVLSLLVLMMTVSASAIPAKPGLKRHITLADGTTVEVRLVGDEHGHFWMAADGRAYQEERPEVFKTVDLEEVRAHAQTRRTAYQEAQGRRLGPKRVGEVGSYFGQKKGLIILVNFADVTFKSSNNNALYQRIANEVGFTEGNFKGSMRDYFYAQSGGQFELTFDVVGPVTVSKNQSYYGSNDYNGDDKYPATMVCEACKKADQYVNYADYDWDNDGYVDQVYVVYAGKGEADGGASYTIWPHAWTLAAGKTYGDGEGVLTLDGKMINSYACGGELNGQTGEVAGIGTMCHEFSHCLGYPDFYDTDYSGGQGMYSWDLMDNGSYNGDGYQPAGYTSYERWMAGWQTPVELLKTRSVTGMKSLQEGGEAYIIYNKDHKDEYYLLENRQKVGWDASLPGKGLLILHVDYNATAWNNNKPNDDPSHQRMTWVPADNKYTLSASGASTDPFPYGSKNAFNKSTTPAAKFFNKNSDGTYYMDSSVESITQNADGTISFNFIGESGIDAPVFSPQAGSYDEAQTVTITCGTEGAVIHYTLDGSTPTANSPIYQQPIQVSAATTIKAIAVTDEEESAVVTANYVIRSKVTLSFDKPTVTAMMEENFETPTLTTDPTGLSVTYSSSDPSVASVNASTGAVTLLSAGTTTITATFAGNTNYSAGSASYTLVVRNNPYAPIVKYVLVTKASELTDGGEVIFVGEKSGTTYGMGAQSANNNNRSAVVVTKNADGSIQANSSVQDVTLEASGNYWYFNVGTGYLYAASSTSNYLRTEKTKDNNAKALVTLAQDGSATIVFQGSNRRKYLYFNNTGTNALFSCYKTSNTYGKVKFYRKVKTLPGDADGNGRVDIMDVFVMANKLMDQSVENFVFENADLLPDKAITITDLMGVVDIILRKTGE